MALPFLKNLESLKLSRDQISQDPQDLLKYGNDWLKQWSGKAGLVLFPKSTADIVLIIQWAREHRCKLLASGGRTGLSGGAVAIQNEVVVSFDKMNRILDFDPLDQTLSVEAGCVTQAVQEFARNQGLYFPLSFASEGSSQIGGNIATNAGGVHVLRYGTMRRMVLGLEFVTGRAEVLQLGLGLVKNSVGYSLKDLVIGSEGSLGFVSKATLALSPQPDRPQVLCAAAQKSEDILLLFAEFKKRFQPLAFEFWTNKALEYVLRGGGKGLDFPLSSKNSPYYVLVELEERDRAKALQVFEKAFKEEWIQDGVLSESFAQAKKLWEFRENISESLAFREPYKNDVSVSVSKMSDFLKDLNQLFKTHYPGFEVVLFGHLGDGNLHINILRPEGMSKAQFIEKCEEANISLFTLIQKYRGSISAEHGVGLLKKPYLGYSVSPEELNIMKSLKKIFDPDNILNPGKIFDL